MTTDTSPTTLAPHGSGLSLLRLWVPAHVAAVAVGAITGAVIEFVLDPGLVGSGSAPRVVGDQAIPFGLLVGITLIGLAQGFALRQTIPGWWSASISGSTVGLVLAVAMGAMLPPIDWLEGAALSIPGGMVASLVAGLFGLELLLGLAQWRVLRRKYSRANYWIPANFLALVVALRGGWILSLLWGMPLAMITTSLFSAARASDLGSVVGGLIVAAAGLISAGTVIAIVTGLAVRWVLQSPAHSQKD